MATTIAGVENRIDHELAILEGELMDLPEWQEHWHELPESQQVSICLDWDGLIYSRLPRLAQDMDEATDTQKARYAQAITRLQDSLPLLAKIGLGRYGPVIAEVAMADG